MSETAFDTWIDSADTDTLLKDIDGLSDSEVESLLYDWHTYARPSQLPPDWSKWLIWFIKTGRGWGKTRTAGEQIIEWATHDPKARIHLVARTAADARDTMVEGESGILSISPPSFMPHYEPSKRRITWPNGAKAILFSAEEPDALRGPPCDCWWADEMASWKYMQETWDQLQYGARLGDRVRGIITTTPRPLKLLREIMDLPGTYVTSGHTYENRANLSPTFLATMKDRYEGSRLGRQELAGELLADNPDALWKRSWIDRDRLERIPEDVKIKRTIVALDPSVTATGDEAGIVVIGKATIERVDHFYVLDDMSIQGSPTKWAKQAITAYHKLKADALVYEANQGGDMVADTLTSVDKKVTPKKVWASKGKVTRAEPIATLAEQGRIHHVGNFVKLEDELCEWTPGDTDSPNRLDAMVWGITYAKDGAGTPIRPDRGALGI